MASTRFIRHGLIIASLALGGAVHAADSSVAADAKAAAKDSAKKSASATVDLQKLIEQLNQKRDAMISDHDALVKLLKDATQEQKKAILEKMEAQKKAFEEATNALHRQIRDEQRRQRQNAAPKP